MTLSQAIAFTCGFLLSQFFLLVILLFKKPSWVRAAGRFLADVADIVDAPRTRHFRRRASSFRRRMRQAAEDARQQLIDASEGVANELTSALVNLGCSKSDAKTAAQLAIRSGVTDFGELLKIAVREASHVS